MFAPFVSWPLVCCRAVCHFLVFLLVSAKGVRTGNKIYVPTRTWISDRFSYVLKFFRGTARVPYQVTRSKIDRLLFLLLLSSLFLQFSPEWRIWTITQKKRKTILDNFFASLSCLVLFLDDNSNSFEHMNFGSMCWLQVAVSYQYLLRSKKSYIHEWI